MSHSVHQSPLRAGIVERLRNIAPINSGRVHNVPLYKRRTKILSHPPPNRVTPVFGTQIFHVDTFDINSIRQGLVPIHGSAVFIRVTRRARSSGLFSSLHCDGSHSGICGTDVYASRAPRAESLYTDCMRFVALCGSERSVWTRLVPGCPPRIFRRYEDISPARRCVFLIISPQVAPLTRALFF